MTRTETWLEDPEGQSGRKWSLSCEKMGEEGVGQGEEWLAKCWGLMFIQFYLLTFH